MDDMDFSRLLTYTGEVDLNRKLKGGKIFTIFISLMVLFVAGRLMKF